MDGRPLRVFTLTAPGRVEDIAQWNLTSTERFSAFLEELRRTFVGKTIDYWKVTEYQRRGLIHFHGIIAGLAWVDLDWLKRLAVKHGFGPRLEFHAPTGGLKRLCGYYTKYVLKNATTEVPEHAPLRLHVVTSSHGWAPDWRHRRPRTTAAEWAWVPEGTWWAAYGRREFIVANGGDTPSSPEHSCWVASQAEPPNLL